MRSKLDSAPGPALSESRPGLVVPRLDPAPEVPLLTKVPSLDEAIVTAQLQAWDEEHGPLLMSSCNDGGELVVDAGAGGGGGGEEDCRLVQELTEWVAGSDEADSAFLQQLIGPAAPQPGPLDALLTLRHPALAPPASLTAMIPPAPPACTLSTVAPPACTLSTVTPWRTTLCLRVPTLGSSLAAAIPPGPPATDAPAAVKSLYRARVAIPRYHRKRLTRRWTQEIMHESRSQAAFRRPRKIGKFHRTTPQFVAVTKIQHRQTTAAAATAAC